MGYLLDTDICIFYFKDKYGIPDKIKSVGIDNCYVSEITILELTYGALNSSQIEKHKNEVIKLEQVFGIIPIYTAKDVFAKEKTRLRQVGNLIPDFDLLIASSAIANDMILVTRNMKHMERVEGIQIENWTDIG